MRKLIAFFAAAACLQSTPALAYDWSVGAKVTLIEATYAPWNLPFQVNKDAGNCRAGSMLYWHPKGSDATAQAQNYQALLAVLLTAKATGQLVQVFGNNSDCSVDFLYIISS